MSNLILCFVLCTILTPTFTRNRLFIRDDPIPTPIQDSFSAFVNSRQLADQSYEVKDAVTTTMIHGSTTLGYYFTTLHFGTPSQPQTLIVDTGSTITTVPCNECGDNCGTSHFNEYFDSEASQTFTELKCREPVGNYVCSHCDQRCDFTISYSEGSMYRGQYKKDYVSFQPFSNSSTPKRPLNQEGNSNTRVLTETTNKEEKNANAAPRIFIPFGCTLKETNLFLTQEADGIFGLGVKTNSFEHPPNIVDALHSSDGSVPNAFSICAGQQGGYLAVGGYNRTYHASSEKVQYTPYDGSNGQYRVHWNNIKFNGEQLDIATTTLNMGRGAYIDSGTTMLYTTPQIANLIKKAITAHCEKDSENCGGNMRQEDCWYHSSESYPDLKDFYATFGTYTFDFGSTKSVIYEWKPEDYLFRYSEDQDFYCMGIDSLGGSRTIFGGTFMKNHDVLFDKENHQIGFIRSNCSAGYVLATYPQSKIAANTIAQAEEEEPIPSIILYGALAISIMILFSCYLTKCRSAKSDEGVMSLELGSPDGKSTASYQPVSYESVANQEFTALNNVKNEEQEPEEFAV